MSGQLKVVVGGQYGSEAKGSVAAHLARCALQDQRPTVAMRVAGPNAGHTAYDNQGRKWSFRQLPVAAVVDPNAQLMLAAGSEIDLEVLADEIQRCHDGGIPVADRLYIDPQASILDNAHKRTEGDAELTKRIGSTSKGIGACRSDRIMRTARIASHPSILWFGGQLVDTANMAQNHLRRGGEVHIEGTQGYGLGLHAGHYPHCTSSDCRAVDFLAMAGLSPWALNIELQVWITYRTWPIRVAGNSGPLRGELTWDELRAEIGQPNLEPERTTVTQKIRRIGRWDPKLARHALRANGGPSTATRVALTFLDYANDGGKTCGITRMQDLSPEAHGLLAQVETDLQHRVDLIGTGPQTMIDRRPGYGIDSNEQEPML